MDSQKTLRDDAVDLVKTYLGRPAGALVAPDQIPVILEQVHQSLTNIAQRERAATVATPLLARPQLRLIQGGRT